MPELTLILWQGALALTLAVAWIGLWHLPFMQRYHGSPAPYNGVMLVWFCSGLISGPIGFTVDNWLLYALLSLALSVMLTVALAPLMYWRFPALMQGIGRGLMMPWEITAFSLSVFGLLRLALWVATALALLLWSVIAEVIDAL